MFIASRSSNADDLLATIQLFSRQYFGMHMEPSLGPSPMNALNFNRTLMSGFCRHLNLDSSAADKPEALVKNGFIQRYLGYQSALGFQGEMGYRPLEGTLAMVLLHLKSVTLNLAVICAKRTNAGAVELKRPGILADPSCLSITLLMYHRYCFVLASFGKLAFVSLLLSDR